MGITGFYIVKNFTGGKEKIFSIPGITGILFTILPTCFLYQTKYTSLVSLLTFVIYIIAFKRIFKISIPSSVIASSLSFVLIALGDLLVGTIEMSFLSYEFIRMNVGIAIMNNVLVGIVAVLISRIPFLNKKIQNICEKVDGSEQWSILIFVVLLMIVISLLWYNITEIFEFNLYYSITLISVVLFIFLSYFYLDEKNKYQKLNDEYNTLFDYVQNFENWIDDEQMYRHELNNNLGMLRDMVENEEAINKIDDMLKVGNIVDEEYIEDLKNVPKGGLKGLLYYKIAIAKNAGVQMIVDVSPLVTEKIERLSKRQIRSLGIVLGIYLDNAIEAAKESKNGQVTLEIYSLNQEVNFVISNTYKGVIRVEDINKKGYSTKGKGHGKGLYYAMKTINKEKYLSTEQSVLNNFFIQRLVVN